MSLAKRCLWVALTISSLSLVIAAAAEQGERVKQVEAKYVCMLTKKHFDTEQMAVKVEGRTYYACCDMCKTQLREDPAAREAVDPVTGHTVDKATAVLGVDTKGNVYFFENTQNLKVFRVPADAQK